MCFTVAILRDGVLMTAEQYQESLPEKRKKKEKPVYPEFPDMFMAYGFDNPSLPIMTDEGLVLKKWGLIPSWTPNNNSAKEIRNKTLNAKAETIFELPSFRNNIISRRCILPVTGFFENRDVNKVKYPYYIQPAQDICFNLGAIYDSWCNQANEIENTFSIITTEANPLMEMIHNTKKRMPLIIDSENLQNWLNPAMKKKESIEQFLKPYDEKLMKAHIISKVAVKPTIERNTPEILKEVYYPELSQTTLF